MRALLWLAVAAFLVPVTTAAPPEQAQDRIVAQAFDAQGRLVWERGLVAGEDGLAFDRFYRHADPVKPDNPGNGNGKGGGGGDDGGGSDPGTDCESDKYQPAGWFWATPFEATADAYVSEFAASAQAWEDAAGANILEGVTFATGFVAGERDFQNHFSFANLGAGGTIAVTTTWYYRGSGQAVESDAQYNSYYDWATDGSPDAMDVQNIATHEVGHTFGLTHPNGPAHKIGCLTMYAYGSEGETQKRTLGDGDILGIQALYGA